MVEWLTPDRVLLSMVSDNDHRVILDLLSQIPFQKAMRQRGEPPLTLKDLRAFRTLRDFEIASKKPNKATPALLILRKVQRRLRVYERHTRYDTGETGTIGESVAYAQTCKSLGTIAGGDKRAREAVRKASVEFFTTAFAKAN